MNEGGSSKIRGTLYITEAIWDTFQEICFREGESMSSKVEDFMFRYCDVHSPGNPQMRLDRYGALIKHECFWCHQSHEELFKVEYISGLVAPTCGYCLEQNKRKGTFSTIRKVHGVVE